MIAPGQMNRPALEKSPLARLVNDWGMRVAGRAGVGLDWFLGSRAGNALGIVTYHRVAPITRSVPRPSHNVTPRRFRQQLSGLLNRGFTVWPLSRILKYRSQGTAIPPRTLVVTFDDGFQTVYTHAWPVLRELHIPATLFLTTAYLDCRHPFWFDLWGRSYADRVPPEAYRPLSSAQCQEMAQHGLIEFGAHTHTHADFRHRADDFQRDLQTSVDIVRTRFGPDGITFAFPFGSVHQGYASDALKAAAKETGVVCGLTTQGVLVDIRSDPFSWGRFNAFPWDTAATLAAKLHGWYSWAPRLRQQIARSLRRSPSRAAAPSPEMIPDSGKQWMGGGSS